MLRYRLILLAGLVGQLSCKSIKSSFDVELKEPIVKPLRPARHDQLWLQQFFYILFNYSTLLIPILSIVYLVKNNLCHLSGMVSLDETRLHLLQTLKFKF